MTNLGIIDELNPQGVPKLGMDFLKKAELKSLSLSFFYLNFRKLQQKSIENFPKILSLLNCYKVGVNVRSLLIHPANPFYYLTNFGDYLRILSGTTCFLFPGMFDKHHRVLY